MLVPVITIESRTLAQRLSEGPAGALARLAEIPDGVEAGVSWGARHGKPGAAGAFRGLRARRSGDRFGISSDRAIRIAGACCPATAAEYVNRGGAHEPSGACDRSRGEARGRVCRRRCRAITR